METKSVAHNEIIRICRNINKEEAFEEVVLLSIEKRMCMGLNRELESRVKALDGTVSDLGIEIIRLQELCREHNINFSK